METPTLTSSHHFLQQLNLFALTVTANGQIQFANAYTLRMMGWERGEVKFCNFFQ
ncbi:MAG: PAS domain-containing protein [Runella sp.]